MTSNNTAEGDMSFPLWSDEPSTQDLLSFGAVASTVVDALFDVKLDPVALGISGAWGSGKTTVLELVKAEIATRSEDDAKILVVPVEPWRVDPGLGPKETIIGAVLAAIAEEVKDTEDAPGKALGMVKSLAKRVNWSKALKMAAMTSVTLQLPKPEDVLGLINDGTPDEPAGERGLGEFREDFERLLASDELAHVQRVVVLVDDLDRCLPDTVVETLETIRLFLSAKGMSFVIAADELRVSDAIQRHLGTPPATGGEESPASLYLHKIVQTTIPLPGLSRFDTQSYLFLLLAKGAVDEPTYTGLIDQSTHLRMTAGSVDDLDLGEHKELPELLATASRLTPILYEKFKGNPRRIKRFLNDLNVRQAVAVRRGIALPSDAVAKLMVLERLLPDDFNTVLQWLALNELRDQLEALDKVANAPAVELPAAKKSTAKKAAPKQIPATVEAQQTDDFTDTLIRWAKLPPSLDATNVSSYLYLAASFAGIELTEEGLPERLRDLAAGLSSSLKIDRAAVTKATLEALPVADARTLVTYLGRRTRDQPALQKFTVEGMLRIAAAHEDVVPAVIDGLRLLPVATIEPATALKLKALDPARYGVVVETWKAGDASDDLRRTLELVEQGWTNHGD